MDEVVANRRAWESASEKHIREYDEISALDSPLFPIERELLAPLLATRPAVVHLQSGWGLDDIFLVRAGAASVVAVDYSTVAVGAAQRRARELGVDCRYVVGALPGAPLADGCADLVYTGKGALIWMPDIKAWARDAARLLRPSAHLFIYEHHPAATLWSWDADQPRVRPDRGYFTPSYANDSYPAGGSTEWQWTLGETVTALIEAGLEIRHLSEHPEPFWRMGGVEAAAWDGRLPNTYALLARKPALSLGRRGPAGAPGSSGSPVPR